MANTTGQLTKNFSVAEAANNLATDEVKLVLTPEVLEHAQMMQELRDWYGKPLNVNSWYRTVAFNKHCGGSANSAHLDGRATDISNIPRDMYEKFMEAWKLICAMHGKVGGCNYYNTFMHFCSYEDKFGHTTFQIRDNRK